jgi:hypothetical protein
MAAPAPKPTLEQLLAVMRDTAPQSPTGAAARAELVTLMAAAAYSKADLLALYQGLRAQDVCDVVQGQNKANCLEVLTHAVTTKRLILAEDLLQLFGAINFAQQPPVSRQFFMHVCCVCFHPLLNSRYSL